MNQRIQMRRRNGVISTTTARKMNGVIATTTTTTTMMTMIMMKEKVKVAMAIAMKMMRITKHFVTVQIGEKMDFVTTKITPNNVAMMVATVVAMRTIIGSTSVR